MAYLQTTTAVPGSSAADSEYVEVQKVMMRSFSFPSIASFVKSLLSVVGAIPEHADGDGCILLVERLWNV